MRSVLVRFGTRGEPNNPKGWKLSYLVPPGDDPRAQDLVWCTAPGVTCRDWADIKDQLMVGTVVAVDDVANPLATKMYLAWMPRVATVARNEQNNARAALVASLQTKDK